MYNTVYRISQSLSQDCLEESRFDPTEALAQAKNALFKKYLGKLEAELWQATLPDPVPWGNGASVSSPPTAEISPPVLVVGLLGLAYYRRVRRTSDGVRHIEDSYDQLNWIATAVLPRGVSWTSAEGGYFLPTDGICPIVLTYASTTGPVDFGPGKPAPEQPAPATPPKKPLPDPTVPARRRYRLKE